MTKLLEGKVVVITGSGGGLGRAYALACAAEGAKVVVNDLGSARDGTGATTRMADGVVEEIRKEGGTAVANYDSVATTEGAERIIRTALEAFGRIDVLVNNAGILRDKTLLKMEDDMWDLVLAVHLRGTFACTRAAARAMVERQIAGSIINVSSLAGLRGNFGQSNYSAAKAGIYGFTLTTAMELGKHGIRVNCIAPIAKTRMTEDIEAISEDLKPEQVAPVVVYLASDLSRECTGRIFGVHGSHIFEYSMTQTEGFKKEGLWTPQEIHRKLTEPKAAAPAPAGGDLIRQVFMALPGVCEAAPDWNAVMHFAIAGAGDYTIEVSGGKAKVAEGKPAQPTCVVQVDAATMTGMIQGTIKPDTAFMQGKIKANNLKDLQKFGKAFKFEKLRGQTPAAPAPAGDDVLGKFFEILPGGFEPDKAKDWNAVLHFAIAGAGDWTVEVRDGKVRTARGKPAQPTCVVQIDAATMIGMINGTVNPDMAYMQGKIKANNLKDLGKFGKAFNFKKLREGAPAAAAPAGTSGGPVNVWPLIEGLSRKFVAEKAAGWNGAIQFAADGTEAVVEIQNGSCSVRQGRHPAPALVISGDAATLAGVLQGRVDAQKAMAEGKLKLSNPIAFLKVKQCFRFEPDKGLNRTLIGRTYRAPAFIVRPEWIDEYGRVVGDPNSPIFPVKLVKPLFLQVLEDPDFNGDLSRMVHGEQVMIYHEPLKAMDLVSPRGRIAGIEDKSTGQILSFVQTLYCEGRPVVEMDTRLFFRGESGGSRKAEERPERPQPEVVREFTVAWDLSYRYAKVSGDDNPIHIDEEFAKAAGFKGVILHGLCTLALTVGVLREGRPIRKIAVRFARPVYPGETYRALGWRQDDRTLAFETVNASGEAVLTQGQLVFWERP